MTKPISHWNYRMFHRVVPDGQGDTSDEFTIREAYYEHTDDTLPHSWTTEPSAPFGETKLSLMEDVSAMSRATSQPVVELTPDGDALAADQPSGATLR